MGLAKYIINLDEIGPFKGEYKPTPPFTERLVPLIKSKNFFLVNNKTDYSFDFFPFRESVFYLKRIKLIRGPNFHPGDSLTLSVANQKLLSKTTFFQGENNYDFNQEIALTPYSNVSLEIHSPTPGEYLTIIFIGSVRKQWTVEPNLFLYEQLEGEEEKLLSSIFVPYHNVYAYNPPSKAGYSPEPLYLTSQKLDIYGINVTERELGGKIVFKTFYHKQEEVLE